MTTTQIIVLLLTVFILSLFLLRWHYQRKVLPPLDRFTDLTLHDRLHDAIAKADDEKVDEILSECPDPECRECGRILCPFEDPLHFHHDGCPSCAFSRYR